MFLKNKNIIFKIRRSKVTDYAALNNKKEHNSRDQKRQISGVLTNHLLGVWKPLLSFSKYFLTKYRILKCSVFTFVQYSIKSLVHIKYCCIN